MLTPENAGYVRDVAVMQALLPYLRVEIDRNERAIENRVMSEIEKGTLTPEQAMYAWIEKRAYRKILSRFDQRLVVGQSIAADNAQNLDIPA